MKPLSIFALVLRAALGAVFIVSGFQKLISPSVNFAAVIESYQIVQGPLAQLFAQFMPWVEFLAGLFFLLGLWTRVSLALLWSMNTLFIGVLSSALVRKLDIGQCGCFGKAVTFTPQQMLGLDIVFWFLFFSFFLLQKRSSPPSADRLLNG